MNFTVLANGAVDQITSAADFLDTPLQEMVQLKIAVPGALTKLRMSEAPATITVITENDILLTPARNITDLIETYVPGAIWMNYEEGPQLGVRGIIANHNFKYLLRVNGRLMNSRAQYGAISELEQWDLSDIQRIEVVRGSGSVTYGPGAVGGVINIITHSAKTSPGLNIKTQHINRYDSSGFSIKHGFKSESFSVFSFASITRTQGYAAAHFLGNNSGEVGHIGDDIELSSRPLDYFGDYQDEPQIKLHIDVDFMENWRFWFRYTQQGSNWKGNETKTIFNDRYVNQQGLRARQWTSTLQYDSEIREDLSFSSMISIDSMDIERRVEGGGDRHPDPDHVLNFKTNFSETEVFLQGKLNWQLSEDFELAFGGEYSRDDYGPGWNEGRKDMRLGEDGIIVSSENSNAISATSRGSADRSGRVIFAGSGWETDTYALFAESNVRVNPNLKLLLSMRADKNTHSDWLYSPRIALISELKNGDFLKFIAQQSQRMATAGQLYAQNEIGDDPNTETLSGAELIYSGTHSDKYTYNITGYWNDAEVIAWDQNLQTASNVGDLKLYGIELELKRKMTFAEVGLSYSMVKQLDWDLNDGVVSSGISYSDYNQPLNFDGAVMTGVGNDINNWPNQSLKFYINSQLSDNIILHIDSRIQWDYQGAKDGLASLTNAVAGLAIEEQVQIAVDKVNDANVYDYDFRLNASIAYRFDKNVTARFYIQNLLGSHDNKRYSYDTGNNRSAPKRVRVTEEPRTFGIQLDYQF